MSNHNLTSGRKAAQAAREDFEPIRAKLGPDWKRKILDAHPELNAEPHLTRLRNIRLGRVAPSPEEVKLFAAVLPVESKGKRKKSLKDRLGIYLSD